MTTTEHTRQGLPFGMIALALLAAALAIMTLNIPGIGEIPFDYEHAVARHGETEVNEVIAAVTSGPGGEWRCKNGKRYKVVYRPDGKTADIVPIDGGEGKTGFRATRDYIARKLADEGCERDLHVDHDGCNGALPQ